MSRDDSSVIRDWERIRRYAVPTWMIAECTAARARGDWRAACEAAGVEVDIDDEAPVADLLAGFAPDLLRWHLPRTLHGSTAVWADRRYLLAAEPAGEFSLLVRTFPTERLTLRAVRWGELAAGPVIVVPAYLWDARRAMQLREPASFTAPAATADELQGWLDAGWDYRADQSRRASLFDPHTTRLNPLLVAHELRRVIAQFGVTTWPLHSAWSSSPPRACLKAEDGRFRIAPHTRDDREQRPVLMLHPDMLRPPVDLQLVGAGVLRPEQLHPLVRAALFPAGPSTPEPDALPGLLRDEMFRVRCRGLWHWVGVRSGRIDLTEHHDSEREREHALAAFGGRMSGCFAAERAWFGGPGRLPRGLRDHRRDLMLRLEHGGVRLLEAMLDAGLDPRLRDAGGRTLIHMLRTFGDPGLLPRLTAAGLDVNTADKQGYTPLYEAVQQHWPSRYIIALVDAGAHTRASVQGVSLRQYIAAMGESKNPDLTAAITHIRRNQ
ncbi:ankyrin repeat domain-containing protein [Actinoplanes sp. G11-F43]|uniref:ankyrin repeat domain-containing protein n=1 Tax=Actinoplanes sp. G11-F43 TaxID=3424130 RepID=UPI003D32B39F